MVAFDVLVVFGVMSLALHIRTNGRLIVVPVLLPFLVNAGIQHVARPFTHVYPTGGGIRFGCALLGLAGIATMACINLAVAIVAPGTKSILLVVWTLVIAAVYFRYVVMRTHPGS